MQNVKMPLIRLLYLSAVALAMTRGDPLPQHRLPTLTGVDETKKHLSSQVPQFAGPPTRVGASSDRCLTLSKQILDER